MKRLTLVAAIGLIAVQNVDAQTLARRVAAAPDGVIRMSYPARPDVCDDGRGYWTGSRGDKNWTPACAGGPVRAQLTKDGAAIVRIRTYVGGAWQPLDGVTSFDDVDPAEASAYFLDLAASAPANIASDAIVPAILADAPDPWRRLLEIARDVSRGAGVRKQAIFWLGQSAADEVTAGLTAIVNGGETEMQKAAVFALSQREDPARIDHLIRIARSHQNPHVVKAALFWLADSESERAVDLFEEILTR